MLKTIVWDFWQFLAEISFCQNHSHCCCQFHAAVKSPFVGKGCRMKCHEKVPLALKLLPQHFLEVHMMLTKIQDSKPNKHPLVSRQDWKKFYLQLPYSLNTGVSAITKFQCNITFKCNEYLPIYTDLPNSYQNLSFPLQLQIKVKL